MKSNYKQRLARSFKKIQEDKKVVFKGGLIDREMHEEEVKEEIIEKVRKLIMETIVLLEFLYN